MQLNIVQEVITELETLGSEIVKDLGLYGASLVAAIKHDCKMAFDAAVAAGKYAVDTFEQLAAKNLADFWATAKLQIAASAKALLETFATQGFGAAVSAGQALLANINWREVATALTGIGTSTLEATAMALVRMLISGLVVAA